MLSIIDLPLNQLVYTKFADVGFKLLTSKQVPLHIQHTFLGQVVYRYSNALYEFKNRSFRAIYLLEVSPEQWLFGWLYNDENDELDNLTRSHIPYFICYYLAEPLYGLRIEKVCACLQNGPVELIDRHRISGSLEPLILKDLGLYEAARLGVMIPWKIREQIYIALQQGKLIDIFIPVNESEQVISLQEQVKPEQLITKDESTDDNSLLPLIPVNESEQVISLQEQVKPEQLITKDESTDDNSLLPLIPVNESEQVISLQEQVKPEQLITKDESTDDNSLLLSRNSILLIGMGLGATTIIVVMFLIYVFFRMTILIPKQPTQLPSQNVLR